MRQLKWIGSLLWLLTGAVIVPWLLLIPIAALLSVNYGVVWKNIERTTEGLYGAIAHLAIFAQVAIGVALVMVGIPLLLAALLSVPIVLQLALMRLFVALAEHFVPLWKTVRAGPFPKDS